jgi:hypothetical protein
VVVDGLMEEKLMAKRDSPASLPVTGFAASRVLSETLKRSCRSFSDATPITDI